MGCRRRGRASPRIADEDPLGRGTGQRKVDRHSRSLAPGPEIGGAEGGRQVVERYAFAGPPAIGHSAEEFERRAVFSQQHAPDSARELGADPGVGHVADIVRNPQIGPYDLGPAAPPARPPTCEHDGKQAEGVIVSTQRHKGVEVAQVIGRVVGFEIRRRDLLHSGGGAVVRGSDQLGRKRILDAAGLEDDRG